MFERPLAYVCFPIKGDASANQRRARQYARKVFDGGLEPFVPNQFYATFLDDTLADERKAAVKMGLNHLKKCRILIVCSKERTDTMQTEIDEANRLVIPVVSIDGLILEKSSVTAKNRPQI